MFVKRNYFLFTLAIILFIRCTENVKVSDRLQTSRDSLAKIAEKKKADSLLISSYKIAYKSNIDAIDAYFTRQHKWRGFNGNVLYAIKGVPIYTKSFGLRRLRSKDSLQLNDAFQLASASKPITATAILQLYEKGKLNLNDSIKKFIPDFPDKYKGVTIHQLLSHQSGLFEYDKFNDEEWRKQGGYLTFKKILDKVIEKQPHPYYRAGRKFDYLNFNYVILAQIVESISNKSFEEYLKENIFNIAGMNDAFVFNANDSLTINKKRVYGHKGRRIHPLDYQDGVYGDKGIFASVYDMLAFSQAYENGSLISDSTKLLAQSPKVKKWRSHKNYGYGWRLDRTKGKAQITYHNGWWKGYKSKFIRVENNELTIIVLSNRLRAMDYSYRTLISFIDKDQFKK